MKKSIFPVLFCVVFSLAAKGMPSQFSTAPVGFEDPALMQQVMGGDIVMKDLVDSKVEFRTVSKAFFKKVSPTAYAALAVNHPKYADLFDEVKEGETTKVSADKTEYDYKLHLVVSVGPFTQDVYPEGHQKLILATDAVAESRIENVITNYQDQIKSATQTTRLIPYQDGMLVEDDIHVVLPKPSATAGMIKKKLKEFFTEYVSSFRKELQGDY